MDPDQRHPHLTRRTALRTTAHAAWVTPVVIAAAAAPAFAASGPADLKVLIGDTSILRPQPDFNYVISAPTQIVNFNTQASTSVSITLEVRMDDGGSWNGLARTPTATADGWVVAGPPTVSGVAADSVLAPSVRTWRFTTAEQVPGNGMKPFNVLIDTDQNAVVVRGLLTITVDPGAVGAGEVRSARFGPTA